MAEARGKAAPTTAAQARQLSIVQNVIDNITQRLSALPPSRAVEGFRARAEEYHREVGGWKSSPPTAEEGDKLMMSVIELHIEVAKLGRQRAGT